MNDKYAFEILYGDEMPEKKSFTFRFGESEYDEYMYIALSAYFSKRAMINVMKSLMFPYGRWRKHFDDLRAEQKKNKLSDAAILKEVGKHRYWKRHKKAA